MLCVANKSASLTLNMHLDQYAATRRLPIRNQMLSTRVRSFAQATAFMRTHDWVKVQTPQPLRLVLAALSSPKPRCVLVQIKKTSHV